MAADEIANASRKLNASRPARSIHHRMPAITAHRTATNRPTRRRSRWSRAARRHAGYPRFHPHTLDGVGPEYGPRQARALAVRVRFGPATHNETAQTATATSTTGISSEYDPVASKAAAPR